MSALRILGVHGVRNYQLGIDSLAAAERLAGWWTAALLSRHLCTSDDLTLRVAYYAHRLITGVPQGEDDPGQLDSQIQHDIMSWVRLLGALDETAQGMLTMPARVAVDWVAQTFGLDHRLARGFVSAFFREIHTYFTEASRRQAILADIASAIERWQPQVIIAHSLGSVVTYESLWTHPHPDVGLLLTLGSPLAMPDIVYPRLAAHTGPRSRPPGVSRWINISDPGDLIAIPRNGVSGRFECVTADLTDAIHAFDFHRVTNYLTCGATAGVLAAYL